MLAILIGWIVSALAIIVAAYLLPGVRVDSFTTGLVVAVVLGIINAFLKPLLLLLTLPINIVTLGLFTLVINALLVLVAASIVPGFHVDGFWAAFFYAIVLSLINMFLHTVVV